MATLYNDNYSFNENNFSDFEVVSTVTSTEPVTRDEAKNYLRVDHTDDDTLIDNTIAVARAMVESFINRDILSRERRLYMTNPGYEFSLPFAPINSSVSITITDEDSNSVEFEQLGFDNPIIRFEEGIPENITVTYTTRAMDAGLVKQSVLCAVASLYYGRDSKVPTNWQAYASHLKETFI